jgi:hypothetical protein
MVCPVDEIGQTIEAFEERRLATSCRTENGKDLVGPDVEINILKRL